MKHETLYEAAANLADPNLCKTDNWIAGARWQRERSYDEEDIIQLIQFLAQNEDFNEYSSVSKETAKYYLERFKTERP